MSNERKVSTREKIAAGVSGALVLAIVVYWITQIAGVVEMLRLAYGGE
jgi:hypothetical protein